MEFFSNSIFAQSEQVGFDETITILGFSPPGEQPQFEIKTRGVLASEEEGTSPRSVVRRYRTKKLVSRLGIEMLRGHDTRAREGRERNEKNEEGDRRLIPKDCRTVEGQPSEGQLHRSIAVDAERASDTKYVEGLAEAVDQPEGALREIFERSIAEVLRDGDVCMREPPETMPTSKPSRTAPPDWLQTTHGKAKAHIGQVYSSGNTFAQLDSRKVLRGHQHVQFPKKIHYCMIIENVGKPIFAVRSLREAFRCIDSVLNGEYFTLDFVSAVDCFVVVLLVLHESGWVHRDISYGNLLVVGPSEELSGVITDFEYAKNKKDAPVRQDVRTVRPSCCSLCMLHSIYRLAGNAVLHAPRNTRIKVPVQASADR